ncbi:MAG: lytic transglycosylase domain-containing protein [Gammaproteobacteria bacterium]
MSLRKIWWISLVLPMSAHAVLFGESSHFGAPARFSDPMGAPRHAAPIDSRAVFPTKQLTLPCAIRQLVDTTAKAEGVDPALAHAVIRAESNGNPSAVSRTGAVGLMQLMPATAQRFGVTDSFDSVVGGIKYLGWLGRFFNRNVPLMLAGYNAGEHAVIKHGGIPPYAETQNYVAAVLNDYALGDLK